MRTGTQTKHERDGMGFGDSRNRPQMAGDDVTDSQALTGGDITRSTEHLLHESATCHKTDQMSSSRQGGYVVRWPNHRVRDMKRVKRIGRIPRRQAESKVLVPLAAEWRAGSVFRRQLERRRSHSTVGVSWSYHERRTLPQGTASRYGPRSSKWCHCPPPRASCTPQSKPHQKEL